MIKYHFRRKEFFHEIGIVKSFNIAFWTFRFCFCFCFFFFFNPWPWLEGSYKIGSVHSSFCLTFCLSFRPSFRLSFLLSVSFLGVGTLGFNMVSYIDSCVWQSQISWKISPSGKNDQKLSKMVQKQGFWTF